MRLFDLGKRVELKAAKPRILVAGDAHFPFADKAKVSTFLSLVRDLKPTHVIQIGDLYDMYTFSRFARSVNLVSSQDELEAGRAQATAFWKAVKAASPKADCTQVLGNHSARLFKSLLSRAPEFEPLVAETVEGLLDFPGVRNMGSPRSELVINDIVFIHGWSCRPGFHRDYFGQSVVHGHTHHAGISYKAQKGTPLFELDCGHMADSSTLPLSYGETKTTNWIAGCGFIDAHGPRVILL